MAPSGPARSASTACLCVSVIVVIATTSLTQRAVASRTAEQVLEDCGCLIAYDAGHRLWSWQICEHCLKAKAGIVPGKDGSLIKQDTGPSVRRACSSRMAFQR
jgi:hypothetical protein